ncbi:hypothetical protein NPIL_379401 [Nephila pilipes]|uniref:RED-like N-terminal domain-containing protein n=1 Tax=Nephila pilipes TaxID=299642 RepID=A0A8X6MYZ4_NEPPI|nr:hypothetical protein NPIL_379401 [Nephila pilipes]
MVLVPYAVSKKLTSDLLLSTAVYEALKENMQVYGHESPSNDDVHVTSEEKTEDPSASTEALVEVLSTMSGNENVTQRNRYRAEERKDGVNTDNQNEDAITSAAGYRAIAPDANFGLDIAERRRQMIQKSKFLGGNKFSKIAIQKKK